MILTDYIISCTLNTIHLISPKVRGVPPSLSGRRWSGTEVHSIPCYKHVDMDTGVSGGTQNINRGGLEVELAPRLLLIQILRLWSMKDEHWIGSTIWGSQKELQSCLILPDQRPSTLTLPATFISTQQRLLGLDLSYLQVSQYFPIFSIGRSSTEKHEHGELQRWCCNPVNSIYISHKLLPLQIIQWMIYAPTSSNLASQTINLPPEIQRYHMNSS